MNVLLPEGETLHQGWLTKSPPLEKATYPIFKAQWKRRWFVLQEKRGQYRLHYFDKKKTLKGSINLDECEQVDIGLTVELGKQRFPHIFDIKTPNRLYYLAADTKEEMTAWVRMVCSACGFKPAQDEENNERDHEDIAAGFGNLQEWPAHAAASQPVGPSSPLESQTPSISNPYIHISSCYTGGKPPRSPPQQRKSSTGASTSSSDPLRRNTAATENSFDLSTGDDSVFLSPELESAKGRRSKSSSQLPLRPPKPVKSDQTSRPLLSSGDNYANSLDMQALCRTGLDCPPEPLPRPPATFSVAPAVASSASTSSSQDAPPTVSRELKPGRKPFGERAATLNPRTQSFGSSAANNPFATMGPAPRGGPPVARGLKPRSGGTSSELDLSSPPHYPPPSAPLPKNSSTAFPFPSQSGFGRSEISSDDASGHSDDQLGGPHLLHQSKRHSYHADGGATDEEEEQIYFYMPSVTAANGSKYPVMIPADSYERPSIAYIDLDLPSSSGAGDPSCDAADEPDGRDRARKASANSMSSSSTLTAGAAASFQKSAGSATAYQKIDFVKTEAFKRMRHKVEEKYNQS